MKKISKILVLVLCTIITISSANLKSEAKIKENVDATIMTNYVPTTKVFRETTVTFSMPKNKIYRRKPYGNYFYSGYLYLTAYVQDDEGRYISNYYGELTLEQ